MTQLLPEKTLTTLSVYLRRLVAVLGGAVLAVFAVSGAAALVSSGRTAAAAAPPARTVTVEYASVAENGALFPDTHSDNALGTTVHSPGTTTVNFDRDLRDCVATATIARADDTEVLPPQGFIKVSRAKSVRNGIYVVTSDKPGYGPSKPMPFNLIVACKD
jgi:hypothetical protein